MSWNDTMTSVIDYTEDILQRKEASIDIDYITSIAGCSYTFFQKVFSYTNGISFADYIRKRKLTLAGYDLKSTKFKIIDISYMYGYDSPTSFTKAFQKFHGCSPSAARDHAARLQVFPKMDTHKKLRYTWSIEKKKAFRCLGKRITIPQEFEDKATAIPAFWSTCQRDGTFSALIDLDEASSPGLMGVFNKNNTGSATYSLMVHTNKPTQGDFVTNDIPALTWAIFECIGPVPQAIQDGWKYIYEEWLDQYPFKHAIGPEIEWFSNGNPYAQDYLSQIWIPILEEER